MARRDVLSLLDADFAASCIHVYDTEVLAGRPVFPCKPRGKKKAAVCRICGRPAVTRSLLCVNCRRREVKYGDPTIRMRGERGKGRRRKGDQHG